MSERNKDLLRRALDQAWNEGDLSAVEEFYAADVVLHGSIPGAKGVEGVRRVISAYRAAFPDLQITIEDLVAEGTKVVNRWLMTGTQKGEFMGVAPTGKRVTSTGISIVSVEDAKIVEIWGESDRLGLMQQLGAVPS
jgi:steroid delta-isomerase-like uncharacterized protein